MKGFKNDCAKETYVTHQNIKVSTAIKIAKKNLKKKPASRKEQGKHYKRKLYKRFPTRAKKKKNICSPHQKIKTITAITITKTSCTIY